MKKVFILLSIALVLTACNFKNSSDNKTSTTETLVISTHGFIKKRSKVPANEIQKAIGQRAKYFEKKQLKKRKK